MPTVDFQYQGTSSTPCPLCGFYGLHNCTGQRVGTTVWVSAPPDWNRLIAVLERAVALAEKLLLNDGLDAVVERLATYTGEERDRDLDAFAEAEGKYGSDSEQFDGSGGVGAQGDDPDAPLVKDALRPTHRDGSQEGRTDA